MAIISASKHDVAFGRLMQKLEDAALIAERTSRVKDPQGYDPGSWLDLADRIWQFRRTAVLNEPKKRRVAKRSGKRTRA